ncbi:MAG: hypothetical protein ABIO44_07735, partial [Saprospiraceae bacterium]
MKNLALIIVFDLFAWLVYAQTPKFSNDFLNLGVGARGLGLGGAVSSSSNDVTSAYWNPATMVFTAVKFQVAA